MRENEKRRHKEGIEGGGTEREGKDGMATCNFASLTLYFRFPPKCGMMAQW
jgi:hypothetical protein